MLRRDSEGCLIGQVRETLSRVALDDFSVIGERRWGVKLETRSTVKLEDRANDLDIGGLETRLPD